MFIEQVWCSTVLGYYLCVCECDFCMNTVILDYTWQSFLETLKYTKKSNLRKFSSYFWFNAFSGFGEQNRLKNKTPDVYFHHSMAKSHIGVTIKLFNVFGGILWELHGWQARLFLFTTRAPWCCTVTAAFHSFWRSSANQQRRSSLGEDSCQYFHMSRAGGELHAVFYFPK